jgi:TRAP-type C4-dicarboxylate transport system permease small subunit
VTYARILRTVALAADWVAGAMLFVVFAALLAQTFMRYVMRSPLTTSQELAMIAFIWFVFWLASTTLSLREHVRFDVFYNALPEQGRRVVSILVNLFYLAIFVWGMRATWEYLQFLEFEKTASLAISYQIAFFPYFIFFAVFPIKVAAAILQLFGRDWRANL